MISTLFLLLLQPAFQVATSPPGAELAPSEDIVVTSSATTATSGVRSSESSAAVSGLSSDLQRLIRSPGWRGDKWGVLVVSLDRGDTIFSYQPDLPLAPASNLKLFTTAAALYYLGPDFRYGTYLMSEAEFDNGVLRGDLILYGTGDPTISDRFYRTKTTVWENFADSLAALGITEIEGDIVGDASYFVGSGSGEGWQESYIGASYAVLSGALSYNDNLVTLHIRPGESSGWRPSIQLIPGGEGIALVNQARTVPAGGRTSIVVTRAAYDGPILVQGQIAIGSEGLWRSVPVADPARYSAAVLRETLERRGIRVQGTIRAIESPEDSPMTGRSVFAPAFDDRPPVRVLAIHQSPPLQEILTVINHKSHNLFADAVLRTVGRVVTGEGSMAGGARAVEYLLECETGPESLAGLEIHDGSGLSVMNRTDPRTMIRLLSYMADSPIWDSYWETLPVAGSADGLRRMHLTRAERNLRAKTGTIDHVSALSGYVNAANGERLAFSIISNNVPSTWRAKRIEDAIGARLATFTRPDQSQQFASTATGGTTTAGADPDGGSPGTGPIRSTQTTAPQTTTPVDQSASPSSAVPAEEEYYRIRSGDTLDGIAKRHRTTVGALRQANPGLEPRRLLPGTTIVIPQ